VRTNELTFIASFLFSVDPRLVESEESRPSDTKCSNFPSTLSVPLFDLPRPLGGKSEGAQGRKAESGIERRAEENETGSEVVSFIFLRSGRLFSTRRDRAG